MEAIMNRRAMLKFGSAALVTAAVVPIIGCPTPSWLNTALNDLPTIGGIAESILSIVALGDPSIAAIAPLITTGMQAVQAGIVTLQALLNDYKAQASDTILVKIDGALTDLQKNLTSVLQIAQIKNSALQATISTGIALAISVISAIQLLIPAAATQSKSTALTTTVDRAQAKTMVPQKIKVLDSTTIKMSYNVVAASCGFGGQVVR